MNAECPRFGHVIRQLREVHGWSQEQLAEKADLNRSYLGEIERGSAMPSLSTQGKLASALGVSLSALMARDEVPAAPPNNRI